MSPKVSPIAPPVQAVFLGSKSLGLAVFGSLIDLGLGTAWNVIHPDDKNDERSNLIEWRKMAQQHNVAFFISDSKSKTQKLLEELRPDIALVCGWYQMLSKETLSLIPKGVWGVHNSLLPKYRGGSPLNWSLINGETIVGCSIFKLEERMDSGQVLHQIEIHNSVLDDVGTILERIGAALISEMPSKWLELITGTAKLREQDENYATYCGQRQENDGNIDWTKSAIEVHNFIKAQSHPYPGAFSYLRGRKIRIISTFPHESKWSGTPGQVLGVADGRAGVLIATGLQTAIEVKTIQIDGVLQEAGKTLMSVKNRLVSLPHTGCSR